MFYIIILKYTQKRREHSYTHQSYLIIIKKLPCLQFYLSISVQFYSYLFISEININPRSHIISFLLAEYVALKAIVPLNQVSVSSLYVLFSLDITFFKKKYDLL